MEKRILRLNSQEIEASFKDSTTDALISSMPGNQIRLALLCDSYSTGGVGRDADGETYAKNENLTSAEFWKWIASGEERQTKRPNQELSTVQLHALASYWLPSFTSLELKWEMSAVLRLLCQGWLRSTFVVVMTWRNLTALFSSFLYLNCFWFCKCFIVPCGKFGLPYQGKTQQPQEQRYPFLPESFWFFKCFIVPCGKFGLPYQVRHSSRKSSAIHSYQRVQHFLVSKHWYGCQCSGFAQMLMHAIARGGCTDTVWKLSLIHIWRCRRWP